MNKIIDQNVKKEHVTNQACFKSLTANEIDNLASLFHEVHFNPGETIVTEGERVDSVYLIISGEADVGHSLIQNNSPVFNHLTTLSANDSIGLNETGFYSLSGIRTATVVAKTAIVALKLNMPEFHGFALTYPHVSEVMRQSAHDFSQNEF